MPAYNFKKQFAAAVGGGEKRQTIRAKRKRQTRAGDSLYFYTGMRTKSCRKILEATCISVEDIVITDIGMILIEGRPVATLRNIKIAEADGFTNVTDFFGFFRDLYGLPFNGDLIKW